MLYLHIIATTHYSFVLFKSTPGTNLNMYIRRYKHNSHLHKVIKLYNKITFKVMPMTQYSIITSHSNVFLKLLLKKNIMIINIPIRTWARRNASNYCQYFDKKLIITWFINITWRQIGDNFFALNKINIF